MVDQSKEAGLRAQHLRAVTASDGSPDDQVSNPLAHTGGSADGTAPETSDCGLSDLTRNRLAAQLRAMYDSIAQQPVPDRFAELIAKLDANDSGKA